MKPLSLFALWLPALAGCLPVSSDRLFGRDFAAAGPAFAALPADVAISPAPMPGVRRVFTVAELIRLGHAHGIDGSAATELCFLRTSQVLSAASLTPVLMRALPSAEMKLEILEFSRYPLPEGELDFNISGLMKPSPVRPDTPVIWRGRLRYGDRRSTTIWAKVRLSRTASWVEANSLIRASEEIRADQLSTKTGVRYGIDAGLLSETGLIAGRRALRSIPAGKTITADLLAADHVIDSGDTVSVEVNSGGATIKLTGRAQTGGKADDRIAVVNNGNGKKMNARVAGKGRVIIDVDQNDARVAPRGAVLR